MSRSYYKINEVAALYDLHPDTLRYYEEQGLLSPKRGENRYRLYGIRDICDLNIIQNLRSLDVPVARIREYMTTRTAARTYELLREEIALIDARIEALKTLRMGAAKRARSLWETRELPVGKCRLLTLGERRCYRLSEGVTLEKDVDFLLKKLEKKHESQLRMLGEHRMGAALDEEWMNRGIYNRYSHAFFICEGVEDHDDALPAGCYVSLLYDGGYENIAQALPKLQSYMRRERLAPAGAPIELYHVDIHDTADRDEYLTEIQVWVAQ